MNQRFPVRAIFPLLIATAACAWSAPVLAAPKPFTATVYWPTDDARLKPDADTPWIRRPNGRTEKVRLSAADAPEIAHAKKETDQPGARESLAYAIANWQERKVEISVVGNSYGRPVVRINAGDESLGLDLVAHGHAWIDTRYSKNKELLAAQAKAKAAKAGLWGLPGTPVEPWKWRQHVRDIQRTPMLRRGRR